MNAKRLAKRYAGALRQSIGPGAGKMTDEQANFLGTLCAKGCCPTRRRVTESLSW
ncbi:MAG: hypothetical protein Ct9H300mP7_0080 [Verrucomicrobiota bacterium]|nr:MAG: hypothetical protein Ct9H300mP7_0080 [Verrucomicrobiota bacterium]